MIRPRIGTPLLVKLQQPLQEGGEQYKVLCEGPVEVDVAQAEIEDADSRRLQNLLTEYRDVFANIEEELGRTDMETLKITTTDGPPVAERPRRKPYHLRDEVRRQAASMEALGIIRPAVSPWSAPILMVKKADNSYRFAIGYRALNERTGHSTQSVNGKKHHPFRFCLKLGVHRINYPAG